MVAAQDQLNRIQAPFRGPHNGAPTLPSSLILWYFPSNRHSAAISTHICKTGMCILVIVPTPCTSGLLSPSLQNPMHL